MKAPQQKAVQKERLEFAVMRLEEAGFDILGCSSEYQIQFIYQGHKVYFFPYTGWHSGSTITDAHGIENLMKQLKY